jgi:transcriptional regulator with PAS, ATPase and Fis domain
MNPKNNSDSKLLNFMVKLCHYIAFETGGTEKHSSSGMDEIVADIESKDLGISLKNKEDFINHLFALTDQGKSSKEISSLAESFGLMLVKLEVKDVRQEELINELKHSNDGLKAAKARLAKENKSLVNSLREKYSPAQFVGECSQMQQLKQMALNIAGHPINTLILGNSGTGKEVFAKIIHFNSPRADKPFVAINCTAIPEALFESEMFGIEKGVATGVNKRKGFFEQAHTGTVFLDEIGDMNLANQAKLLRVLEEQEVQRVGGSKPKSIDVKIISATNADLKKAVAEGNFREDLYYRLNVVEFTLPPLKDRGDDIIMLAEKLLAKNCSNLGRSPRTLSSDAGTCLLSYDWPGNVRELNNEMERAAALSISDSVCVHDLSEKLSSLHNENRGKRGRQEPPNTRASRMNLKVADNDFTLATIEQQVIFKALEKTKGNKTKAAILLGITREGLRKKLIRFEKLIKQG